MNYFEQLKEAIETTHNCKAVHLKTDSIKEVFRGQVIWEGDVETYKIISHPFANKCYAWGYPINNSDRLEIMTVLNAPPVNSPQSAIKIAIAASIKKAI